MRKELFAQSLHRRNTHRGSHLTTVQLIDGKTRSLIVVSAMQFVHSNDDHNSSIKIAWPSVRVW